MIANDVHGMAVSSRAARAGRIVALLSGRPGVGKTTLALNLAVALARAGERTILLDAEHGPTSAAAFLCGAPGERPAPLIVSPPARLDARSVAARFSRDAAMAAIPGWVEITRALRHFAGTVLIDCTPGVSAAVAAAARQSDFALLITTPEPAALADTYAALDILRNHGLAPRVGLAINMTRSACEARRVAARFRTAAARLLGLALADFGHIPLDACVAQANHARRALTCFRPNCAASAALEAISERLRSAAGRLDAGGGLWSRIANVFV